MCSQSQLPITHSQVVGEEGEGEDDPDTVVTGTKKRWQFWKKGGAKKDKNANKFGWIMGVLVRLSDSLDSIFYLSHS